jgi:8-oxo-dGTP pyrophosphatase MutT (NUDIX family)
MQLIPQDIINLFGSFTSEKIFYSPTTRYFPKENDSIRLASVAIVIYKENSKINSLLTLRSDYNGHHSGQVSFPGGKFEESDEDLISTARRECFEEIGIHESSGKYLGKLENLYIPVSGFLIEPHLFFHDKLPQLNKNEREVAALIPFELESLIDPDIKTFRDIQFKVRSIKNTPVFNISGHEVWGATAILLEDLRRIILALLESESRETK